MKKFIAILPFILWGNIALSLELPSVPEIEEGFKQQDIHNITYDYLTILFITAANVNKCGDIDKEEGEKIVYSLIDKWSLLNNQRNNEYSVKVFNDITKKLMPSYIEYIKNNGCTWANIEVYNRITTHYDIDDIYYSEYSNWI